MSNEMPTTERPGWPLSADSVFRQQTSELAMLGPGVQLSLVLMASHPEIAEAVAHHSKAVQSQASLGRLARLSGTLGHAIRIVHGTPGENTQSKTHIDDEHKGINSRVSGSETTYDANSPDAQKWVLTSLYKAGSFAVPRYTGNWSSDTADAFYDGHVQFADFFNPQIDMPPKREEADAYYDETTASDNFGSTPNSQEVVDMVLGRRPESGRITKTAGDIVRLIMEENDPDLTSKLNLTLDEHERKWAARHDRLVRAVYPKIPQFARRSAPPIHLKYFAFKQALERTKSSWASASPEQP